MIEYAFRTKVFRTAGMMTFPKVVLSKHARWSSCVTDVMWNYLCETISETS